MSVRDKALVCLVPFLLASMLWFGLASQAFVEWQEKDKQIAEAQAHEIELKQKLTSMIKIDQERKQLNQDIESLRAAVPKSLDLDILLIDLEKMCMDSHMDLVGVESADAKLTADIQAQEKQASEIAQAGKFGIGSKTKEAALGAKAPEKPKQAPTGNKKETSLEEEVGLNKQVLDISVTGDFPSLIELMKRLHSYQRVTAVNHIEIGLPEAKAKETRDPSKRLKISFLLTAYYLP